MLFAQKISKNYPQTGKNFESNQSCIAQLEFAVQFRYFDEPENKLKLKFMGKYDD